MGGKSTNIEEMIEKYKAELMALSRKAKKEENPAVPVIAPVKAETEPITPAAEAGETENQTVGDDAENSGNGNSSSPAANTQTGYIKVQVRESGGMMPIGGASVMITSGRGADEEVKFYGFTDEDGETPVIPLPAPPMENSEAPGGKNVFAVYDIRTEAPGYRSVINLGVPVFEGITSIQGVQLSRLKAGDDGATLTYEENNPNL